MKESSEECVIWTEYVYGEGCEACEYVDTDDGLVMVDLGAFRVIIGTDKPISQLSAFL